MKAFYDMKPEVFSPVGDGSWFYRRNIKQETFNDDNGEHTQWSCDEVTVFGKPEYAMCVQAVIRDGYTQNEEFALINKYNSYQQGVLSDSSVVDNYKEYLSFVATVKKQVRKDLNMEDITVTVSDAPRLYDLIDMCTFIARKQAVVLSDVEKAKLYRFYPTFDELLAVGKELTVGTDLQDGGRLYRVIQAHTPQSDWRPSNQHALFAYISPHEGTKEDPIPYEPWMLLEKDKYYTEEGVLYKCNQSLNAGYDSPLSGLAAFVEKIEDFNL